MNPVEEYSFGPFGQERLGKVEASNTGSQGRECALDGALLGTVDLYSNLFRHSDTIQDCSWVLAGLFLKFILVKITEQGIIAGTSCPVGVEASD